MKGHHMTTKAYLRNITVRVIEYAIVLLMMIAAVWSLAYVVGGVFKAMGVG